MGASFYVDDRVIIVSWRTIVFRHPDTAWTVISNHHVPGPDYIQSNDGLAPLDTPEDLAIGNRYMA